jgi:hypothetical protein
MNRTAIVARPVRYSQACDPSWPRRRQTAALRTGLGRQVLENLKTHAAAAQSRFPRQHGPEVRPTGVKHAFGHVGPSEFRRAHIANGNESVLPHRVRSRLVQKILPAVPDFGVDSLRTLALTCPLQGRKLRFAGAVEGRHCDFATVGQRRKRLGAEIYANPGVGRLPRINSGEIHGAVR